MLVQRYRTDLHCGACVAKVRPLLDAAPDVRKWDADTSGPQTVLTVEGDGITAERLGALLRPAGYHVLGEMVAAQPAPPVEKPTSYFPLLLILSYLLVGVAVTELAAGAFDPMRAMGRFMAGFFLVFSFFKLLNLRAFADAYAGYDVVAEKWYGYGYVYPFIELGMGIAYLGHFAPLATNVVTLVVMGVSTVGVVKALAARRKIRCACLGTVFNLPMSAVTLVEDVLMVGMAVAMLFWLL
ncbi:copper chaperone [Gemmata sp. JC673]|uniref:Copper chaperone n=1 Tax=Gemmata algarum TaxID=2975278 RepID=A0ABU5EVA1_9BACT|nr:MauE/DoxX family redox-associated membrane protein [Gemmata algarum]MDY3559164.1 copper chaperone [Gemmata algarum]